MCWAALRTMWTLNIAGYAVGLSMPRAAALAQPAWQRSGPRSAWTSRAAGQSLFGGHFVSDASRLAKDASPRGDVASDPRIDSRLMPHACALPRNLHGWLGDDYILQTPQLIILLPRPLPVQWVAGSSRARRP